MKRKDKRTADEAYQEHLTTARAQVALLADHLSAHAKRQAMDPRNWGYVGDLGETVKRLGDVLQSLGL